MRLHSERHLTSRLLVAISVTAASVLSGVVIESSSAAPFAAMASVTPQVQYLGDSTGTTFTFTIDNTGTTDSIGAVQISRPGKAWTVTACPLAPAGWSTQRADTMCRYRSAPDTADDIAPGTFSSDFQVTATVAAGTQNIVGTWSVKVSRSSNFDKPSKLVAAASEPPGLGTTAYSFEVLDAVVDPATTTPGAACPAPSKSAITGSSGHTIVICGRNRTTGTLTPVEAQSSLDGTFVASHGSFSSGAVAPTASSRVLGSWDDVTITSLAGPNKTVLAKIGSASNRTSPDTTLTGYEALNNPPVADNDTATVGEDSNGATVDVLANDSDPDGDPLTVSAVDTTGTAGAVTITNGGADVSYDPNGQFESLDVGDTASDTFSYTASDPFGATDTATVTVTITGVNDPPNAVDDAQAVSEDSSGDTVDVLANDTDPDDTLTVTGVDTTGTTGSVTNNGTNVTYDPNGQFDGLAAGATATDTFTYTASDGTVTDIATVTITINGDDDPPVAVDDSTTVAEDASATGIDVLANDTDVDGGPISIDSVTQPTNGTVVITGGGTGLTYEPNENYCNAPPGTTPDTFTYTLNGGSTATVSVTVSCVDDAPIAIDDSATVAEDAIATTIDVLANDSNSDGGPINIQSVTQPTNGTVVITGGPGGASVMYAPNANYCNAPPGTTPDTFTYTLNGGSTATVSVTVSCADDAPIAVNDSATVAEDASPNAVDVLANDTDIDGGPKSVQSVTQPGNGAVAITGGGTGVTYTPNANYCNSPPGTTPDSFTYTLNGGSTATVSVTVTCVDDAPVAVDDSATVEKNSGANPIDVLANDTDIDGGPISVQSVTQPTNGTVVIDGGGTGVSYTPDTDFCDPTADTFTYTLNGGSTATVSVTVPCDEPPTAVDDSATVAEDAIATTIDVLANDSNSDGGPINIQSVTQPANGTVVITGGPGGSSVMYAPNANYCNAPPGTTLDTFTYTLNGGSTATVSVTVTCADDGPVAASDSATVAEDSSANPIDVLANDTDVDGGTMTVIGVIQPANGSVAITGGGTGVSYTPNANYCNSPPGAAHDTFTYAVNGGSTATVSVTVTCVDDAPVVDTSAGSLAYTENDPPTSIDPGVTVSDPDAGATITGATVAITSNFAAGQDVLALSGVHPGITAGAQVGNTLALTGTATPAAYQAALRSVTYVNTSEGPSTLARTVTFTVTDDTALNGSDTRGVTVTGVNDPPTAVNDTGTTDEDTTLNVASPGVLANDTDVDPGDSKSVVALNGSGTLTQTLPSGASVTIGANGSYTYNPLSAFQGLSTGQQASDSFTYTMQDGAGAQSTATVNITINGVSDAPNAVADSFDAIGNTGLFVSTTKPAGEPGKEITGSVLTNDTDPDTPHASLVVEPVVNAPTTLGGTITIGGDGNFVYHPDDGDTGVTDTFTYRVCDASPCNSGTVANSTGTLSLPIAGQVWYVKNSQAAGGDGTSDTPFDTLVEAETAGSTGDTVYVFDGNNTTTNLDTGIVLEANQRLIGESRPLDIDLDGAGGNPPIALFPGNAGNVPTLTASNEDVVVLAAGVTVDGFTIDPSGTGGGIFGGAGTSNVTVSRVDVTDTGTLGTQPGIELDGTTGTNQFAAITVTNGGSATAIGVRVNNAGTVNFAAAGTVTIATSGAKALDAAGTNMATSTFDDVTVTGSGTGGIRLNTNTGSTTLGDGTGTDLSLQTTSGATAALDVSSAGTVQVAGAGTDAISAAGGPAVDIRNTNGSAFHFDSVSSTNSSGDGINLDANLTTPFTAAAGAISGAAGIAIDVNGGGSAGGDVTYSGAINDGTGASVEVTGRDGGAVTLSGNISDASDSGGGITLTGSSGGTTTFSGTSKVINTGSADAVLMSGNAPGSAVVFSNGGLDIDATSGRGLEASSNGGTIEVSGTGNSIQTTTGRALNITNTPISTNDLTFERIAANGAANGIVLNNTGGAGRGLTVSGNGGACATTGDACTGGTIQSTTGDAISLATTQDVVLNRMKIINNLGNGIRGASVTNLGLRDSVVDNNADDAATDEAGVHLTNLAGTADLTRVLVANSPEDNARIINSSGTLSQLNVTDSTFRDTDTVSPGNNGLIIQADGGSITADVLGSTFLRNRANGLQVITNGTGSMNIEVDDSGTAQSTFNDNNIGVSIAHNSSGTFSFGVRNLTIDGLNVAPGTGGSASPINLNLAGSATTAMVGRVTGNTLTNSNSTTGPGIRMIGNGSATMTVLVDSNTISQVANRGMEVLARDGSNRINATITNNSVTLANALAGDAIRVDAGAVNTDTTTICADIRSNTATTTAVGLFGIRVRQRFVGTTYILEGYAGSPTDDAAVQTFLSNNNNAATTSADHGGAGFSTTADCPTPP